MKRRTVFACGAMIMLLIPLAVLGYCNHRLQVDIDASRKLEAEILAEMPREMRRLRRDESSKLSDEERHKYVRSMMQFRKKQMEGRMSDFFGLSERERLAYLDKRINDDEKRRSDRNAKRSGDTRRASRSVGQGTEQRNPEERAARREEGRRRMLDSTTPEFRAQMSFYRTQLNARRKQRGLPPLTRRRRG